MAGDTQKTQGIEMKLDDPIWNDPRYAELRNALDDFETTTNEWLEAKLAENDAIAEAKIRELNGQEPTQPQMASLHEELGRLQSQPETPAHEGAVREEQR